MTNSNPTFSICIPNYNYENYIGDTIESVLNQTYPYFEIIIADNASTDNSLGIIHSFKDSRIKVIENKYNVGFAPNLQIATMFAKNEYINLLSSDDKMKPNALEEYTNIIKANEAQKNNIVMYSDVEIINSNSQISGYISQDLINFHSVYNYENNFHPEERLNRFGEVISNSGFDILKKVLPKLKTFAPFLSIVYSRYLWQQLEGYNVVRTVGPDKYFNFKLLSLDPKIFYIRKPLFQYRQHGSINQYSQKTNLKQQIDDYLYTLELKDEYLSNYGLKNSIITAHFLNEICFKNSWRDLREYNYVHAWQLYFFSLATHPFTSLRQKRFYFTLLLLLTYPFSGLALRYMNENGNKLNLY